MPRISEVDEVALKLELSVSLLERVILLVGTKSTALQALEQRDRIAAAPSMRMKKPDRMQAFA